MKKKLLSIMTILTALMALLMVTANAGDKLDPDPSAADGWRCTQAIYSLMYDGEKTANSKTVYVYDSNGVLTESDEYGMLESGDWSTEPDSVTTYSYDASGKCTAKETSSAYGIMPSSTVYSYDSQGRLSTVTSDAYGMTTTTTYSYDSQGRISTETSENPWDTYVTTYSYAGNTNQVTSTECNGAITTYTYNSAGQCIKIDYGSEVYNYSYDSNGNKVADNVGWAYFDYEYEYVGTDDPSPFVDVRNSAEYYYEPVLWAAENGIVYGTDDTHFSPNDTCTRAQVVTFLYRAAGEPAVTGENPFTDVKSGEYYYDAVLWGYQNEIVYGTDDTTFSPDDKVTRAQFITFLYRFAHEPTVTDRTSPFKDLQANEYYTDAVLWGYQNGIVYGTDEDKFSPDDTCTRAQVVTFLCRYMTK